MPMLNCNNISQCYLFYCIFWSSKCSLGEQPKNVWNVVYVQLFKWFSLTDCDWLFTFSYPISSFQSTLHLICFDTALCEEPHLSVMTLCNLPSLRRMSMFIFWTIAKSAMFSIIVVSKNKKYPEFILYGWSFIETQM